jgi:hypothetical protein
MIGVTTEHTLAELDDADTAPAYDALRALRPHLTSVEEFVEVVRLQRKEG